MSVIVCVLHEYAYCIGHLCTTPSHTTPPHTTPLSCYPQNKKVVIFYGSQTGTAEEFSQRLAKEGTRYGLPSITFDPEDVSDWDDLANLSKLEKSLAVFCVATHGEGEPTDNAMDFNTWLESSNTDLTGLK